MGRLVHNAFYQLVVFQGHKLFFDNIYWSYSFRRIVGVFYLDFNRHDKQTDKTKRLFSHRMISSPPSNVWQFASQRNQSTVIMNATTDVVKRSTWIRSKSLLNRFFLFFLFLFSATADLFDWIKFDVWKEVVLVGVVLQSNYSRASLARQ